VDEQPGFLQALWVETRPELVSQWRDAVLTANVFVASALPHAAHRFLGLMGFDAEILEYLGIIGNYGTLLTFLSFVITIVLRSLGTMRGALKK
jgi:hypothetical protein